MGGLAALAMKGLDEHTLTFDSHASKKVQIMTGYLKVISPILTKPFYWPLAAKRIPLCTQFADLPPFP